MTRHRRTTWPRWYHSSRIRTWASCSTPILAPPPTRGRAISDLNPTMALTNDATPSNNLAAVVSQLANTNLGFLLDTNTSSPADPGPSNFWYTVRAASLTACGSLLFLSHNAPASRGLG